jgi:Ser/Thr protein kinase RdoA (MazF antagonist)
MMRGEVMNTIADHHHSVRVQRSIMSADALAPIVAQAYALDGVNCQLIKSAMLDTYLVTADAGPTILRIYPAQRRTKMGILAELDVLAYLQAAGISVSVPILQRDGEWLLTLQAPEGLRYAALFTYAPGQPLSQQCTPPNVRAFGHMLAQVHGLADRLPQLPTRPPLDLECLLERPLTDLDRVFGERAAEWAFLQQVASAVRPRIAALPTEPPSYGFCHGDVGAANVHITADGRPTLFDFDMCGAGWRAYDIAPFLIDEPEAVVHAFLDGYESVRTLSVLERSSIPLFQIVQSIWVLGLRANYVNDWGNAALSDRLVNNVLTFIKQIVERERL